MEELAAFRRRLEQIELDGLSEHELEQLQEQAFFLKQKVDALLFDVQWRRAERWWAMLPREEMRTIRLLLKGAQLTPHVLQGEPKLMPLLLLIDIEDPNVVRMWAQMTPEVRAERIEDLRSAMRLTEMRRRTTSWEDEKESAVLAYEVLGLPASATWSDVRKAYRDLASVHHPDTGGDPRMFKAVQKAYKLLEGRYL